jgi:hypothetical protein
MVALPVETLGAGFTLTVTVAEALHDPCVAVSVKVALVPLVAVMVAVIVEPVVALRVLEKPVPATHAYVVVKLVSWPDKVVEAPEHIPAGDAEIEMEGTGLIVTGKRLVVTDNFRLPVQSPVLELVE